MKSYELVLVFSSALDGEELTASLQKAENVVQELGGIIEKQDLPRKTVPGVLCALSFVLDQSHTQDLQKTLGGVPSLLRFMVREAKKIPVKIPSLHKTPTTKPAEEPRIAQEEIDKKLEEIFKETSL